MVFPFFLLFVHLYGHQHGAQLAAGGDFKGVVGIVDGKAPDFLWFQGSGDNLRGRVW